MCSCPISNLRSAKDSSRKLPPFILSRSRRLRCLHSFPTRRSSDLFSGAVRPSFEAGARWLHPRTSAAIVTDGRTRSEEHTSELQSLRHLVCRLLLEKKNVQAAPVPAEDEIDISEEWDGDIIAEPE